MDDKNNLNKISGFSDRFSNELGISNKLDYEFFNFTKLWGYERIDTPIIEKSSIFYAQHAIHEIGRDTFLLFDNGNRKERMTSRAIIFSMRDDQFKLLNSVELPKDLFSFKQGSVYRFNQDKFLFCSSTNSKIVITDIEGKILWSLSSNLSFYRAYYLNTNK